MTTVKPARNGHAATLTNRVRSYPLIDELRDRRSRRFSCGTRTIDGPPSHSGTQASEALTEEEKASEVRARKEAREAELKRVTDLAKETEMHRKKRQQAAAGAK